GDRALSRIMLTDSFDRGRTWSPKRPLTEQTNNCGYYYNCARINRMPDGELVITIDRISGSSENNGESVSVILLYKSNDNGQTWSKGIETPACGIVPDKLVELKSGRRLLSCHHRDPESGSLVQRLWYSDDKGQSWIGPVIVGKETGLDLCEASIIEIDGVLVAFMRENSGLGLPCYRTFSRDNGESWSKAFHFPLPGCHRPSAGFLNDGRVLITYRFMQGGTMRWGSFQNFFAGITDKKCVLNENLRETSTCIFPIDYDPAEFSDTGYSGWVQFEDDEIYIVNYIMDSAPTAFIRGYSLYPRICGMSAQKVESVQKAQGLMQKTGGLMQKTDDYFQKVSI
ncbi:MAG: sialidase family protein, partial [Lentisphaerae bacterium]|nr:sialidase family protein [Lentisphaerota bacterium]